MAVQGLKERAGRLFRTVSASVHPPQDSTTGLPVRDDDTTRINDRVVGLTLGRYEVIRLLGEGGMGAVYLAEDPDLNRQVAIKLVARHLCDLPGLKGQLRREANALAKLNHPNIAQVYDLLDVDEHVGIVMEHLHGETLADRLRRGPMALHEVIRLGAQMAAALAHAHEQNVLHCDFKPGNVFITVRGGVKVVDFGLARTCAGTAHATDGTTTGLVEQFGTPAYMSPEHARGAPLDERSDIFSLGVVLHEMATGRKPAPGGADATSPSALRRILSKLLAPVPSARYQSAAEVAADLDAVGARSLRRRVAAGAAALAVVTALAAGTVTRWWSGGVPPARTRAILAVPPFQSSGTEPSTTYLAEGLTEILTNELARVPGLVVVSNAWARGVPPDQDDPAALARELGASHLVLGRVKPGAGPGVLHVALRVFDADRDQTGEPLAVEAAVDDLLRTSRLPDAVRAQLRSAGMSIGATPPLQGGASYDRAAIEDYARGREYLERDNSQDNLDRALALFDRAIGRDAAFALAHAARGEASWRKYQATRESDWAARAQAAAFDALRLAPDEPAVRYTAAVVLHGTGRRKEAVDELTRVLTMQPAHDDAHRLLGRIHADTGDMDSAVTEFQAAIALRPGFWQNYHQLGVAYYEKGRFREAIDAFTRGVELRPDSAPAFQALGTSYHALGNVDEALRNYERAIAIAPSAFSYSNIGLIHYSHRRFGEAAAAYEKSASLQPRRPSTFRNLGDTYVKLGDRARARSAYRRAVELTREELRINPRDASTMTLQAMCLAKLGRDGEASRVAAAANEIAPDDIQVVYDTAVVHALAGRQAEALAWLRRAIDGGYGANLAAEDDDLEALRILPEFQDVIGRRP